MDKANFISRARASSKFLNQAIGVLGIDNMERLIRAYTHTYGVVTQKLVNGNLDLDVKVETSGVSSVKINQGYVIDYQKDLKIVDVAEQIIDITSLLDDITYNIYVVPKETNYEQGTVSFENNSKIVTLLGSSFNKIDSYEALIIDTSVLGNNGVYPVFRVNNSTALELVDVFSGTTETGIKWKVGANLTGYRETTSEDLIYSYDSYDIVIESGDLSVGYKLATVTKSSGEISALLDKRGESLYTTKALSQTIADDVIKGLNDDITTIDEKASAGRAKAVITDRVIAGIHTGLGMSASGNVLTIAPGVVYDILGHRLEVLDTRLVNLNEEVTNGNIILGNSNYIYLSYVQSNDYEIAWSQSPTVAPIKNATLVGRINYVDSDPDNPFKVLTGANQSTKNTTNSIVFNENPIVNYQKRELFYRDGIFYYKEVDPTSKTIEVLEEFELINNERLDTILSDAIGRLVVSDKLRLSLYPTEEKDNWFFHNGIQSPLLVGYRHIITGWKVGTMEMSTVPPTVKSEDYTAKYIPQSALITNVVDLPLTNRTGEANSTLGVYFYGSGSINTVKLVHNGNVISETNMQEDLDALGQAVIGKIYQVEISIQTTEKLVNIIQNE